MKKFIYNIFKMNFRAKNQHWDIFVDFQATVCVPNLFFWHPTTDYLQTFLRNSKSSPNDAMPACALLNVHITHWGKIHFCQYSKICIKHHQNVWENILASQNEVGLKNFEICNWQNFQLFRSACFLRENSNNLVILQVSSKSNIFDKNSTFVLSVARTPQDPQYKNWDLGSNFYH